MKIVVDTSLIIDHLRKNEDSRLKKLFVEEKQNSQFYLPTVVIFEILSGSSTKKSEVTVAVQELLRQFHKIDLNETIATRAGSIYRDFNQALEVPDYIIAASALEIDGVVATLNKRHFEQIKGLSLYSF